MKRCLRIVTWNANGLLSRIHELEVFLEHENIDVCLVSETHFTKESYVKMRDYASYHAVHPSNAARGGSSVLIRKTIKHAEDVAIQLETMQVATVQIQSKGVKFSISAIYCAPRFNLLKEQYLELLRSMGTNYIIGGDYNAKHTHWGSRLVNPKGRNLFSAAMEENCDFHSSRKPTYWPKETAKCQTELIFS